MITNEKLLPLIARKRNIILYPDKDAIEEWKNIARDLEYTKVRVNSSFMDKHWIEADGPKADIADIIVRILNERRSLEPQTPAQVMEQMAATNPEVKTLIDKLGLEPTQNK